MRLKIRKPSKKDVFYCLIIANIIIWAISYVSVSSFYNDYVETLTKSLGVVEVKAKTIQKSVDLTPVSVKEQIRQIAERENFQWVDYLLRLAKCESTYNQYALGDNGNSRGIFQIHRGYHPDVSDECAYDIECSTMWTMWKINSGHQGLWSCDRLIK